MKQKVFGLLVQSSVSPQFRCGSGHCHRVFASACMRMCLDCTAPWMQGTGRRSCTCPGARGWHKAAAAGACPCIDPEPCLKLKHTCLLMASSYCQFPCKVFCSVPWQVTDSSVCYCANPELHRTAPCRRWSPAVGSCSLETGNFSLCTADRFSESHILTCAEPVPH